MDELAPLAVARACLLGAGAPEEEGGGGRARGGGGEEDSLASAKLLASGLKLVVAGRCVRVCVYVASLCLTVYLSVCISVCMFACLCTFSFHPCAGDTHAHSIDEMKFVGVCLSSRYVTLKMLTVLVPGTK